MARSRVHIENCDNCKRGVPHRGERCPKCHQKAPRIDGIQCSLCAPRGEVTYTNPISGITHLYRKGCDKSVVLAGVQVSWLNVGAVPVTCLECIAVEVVDMPDWSSARMMVDYAKADAEATMKAVHELKKVGVI